MARDLPNEGFVTATVTKKDAHEVEGESELRQ